VDPVQATLAERVREQVRRRRLDPQTDADAVREVAHEVVAEHERRSLTGAVRSLEEPDRVVGGIVADVAGLGPLQPFLDDPTVEEVSTKPRASRVMGRGRRHVARPGVSRHLTCIDPG
jgi:pilus assembly protein CpaF